MREEVPEYGGLSGGMPGGPPERDSKFVPGTDGQNMRNDSFDGEVRRSSNTERGVRGRATQGDNTQRTYVMTMRDAMCAHACHSVVVNAHGVVVNDAPYPFQASSARIAGSRPGDDGLPSSSSFGGLGPQTVHAPCASQRARAPGAHAPENLDTVAQRSGTDASDEREAPTKLQDRARTQKGATPGRGKGVGQKRPKNAGENATATDANAQTAKNASEVTGETLEGREWDRMQRFPATKTAQTRSDGQNMPQNASEIARENADHAGEAQNDAQKSMLNKNYVDKTALGSGYGTQLASDRAKNDQQSRRNSHQDAADDAQATMRMTSATPYGHEDGQHDNATRNTATTCPTSGATQGQDMDPQRGAEVVNAMPGFVQAAYAPVRSAFRAPRARSAPCGDLQASRAHADGIGGVAAGTRRARPTEEHDEPAPRPGSRPRTDAVDSPMPAAVYTDIQHSFRETENSRHQGPDHGGLAQAAGSRLHSRGSSEARDPQGGASGPEGTRYPCGTVTLPCPSELPDRLAGRENGRDGQDRCFRPGVSDSYVQERGEIGRDRHQSPLGHPLHRHVGGLC